MTGRFERAFRVYMYLTITGKECLRGDRGMKKGQRAKEGTEGHRGGQRAVERTESHREDRGP